MGWLDSIKNAIFGGGQAKADELTTAPAPGPELSTKPGVARTAPKGSGIPVDQPAAATAPAAHSSAGAVSPAPAVDVAAILDKAVAAKGQKLDWRKSIVDLLKAIDVDSSLTARKELAAELGYSADTSDSAKMNIWLHKQVMQKLAENGGKLPTELLD